MRVVTSNLSHLETEFSAGAISTELDDLTSHAGDWSPSHLAALRAGSDLSLPVAVARPASADEVAAILRWANETKTAVVPFGAGSGVCDNIKPDGALVMDLGRLDHIGEVDEKSRLVNAGAGVGGKRITEELAAKGWMLGHEPQSLDISTVGGWLATRACGQLSARYGGIEDIVSGFEAVLPDGSILQAKPNPRSSTGPDVASLLLGSEGSLGVIMSATLRVSPIPEDRVDLAIRFDHMKDGIAAARALAQSELRPTLVRLYDADDAAIFLRHHTDEEIAVLLLTSFDGDWAKERCARAAELAGGRPAGADLVAHWWAHRNDAVAEFRRLMAGEGLLGPHAVVDTMEVSGTWTILRDLYHSMKEILGQHAALVGCHVSHVYPDGACLYFTMGSPGESDDTAQATLDSWWEAGMTACLAAGGAISHHHGIGRRKARWLAQEKDGFYELLVSIKKTLDPNGIMNPGVLGL